MAQEEITTEALVTKARGTAAIDNLVTESVQSYEKQDPIYGPGGPAYKVLDWMVNVSDAIIAPWWSRQRDRQLRKMAFDSDFFSGSMYKIATRLSDVPIHVEPRDPAIAAHRRQAERFEMSLYENTEFGKGWTTFLIKWFADLWTQDNGAFAEVIGAGDPSGPIQGPALGLAHLDSARCTRTNNPMYPVLYRDWSGKIYKFHYTRVMFDSQMPSGADEMNNVGHCWLSRALNSTQNLIDMSIYKQEKLGSRPHRQMIIGKGVAAEEIWEAFHKAEVTMDNAGLTRYAKNVVLGGLREKDDIMTRDLVSVPDGFSEAEATEIAISVIAMTGGFPTSWIWPVSQWGSGGSSAQAEFNHFAGLGSSGAVLTLLATMIGGNPDGPRQQQGKVLPPHLKLVFDYQDDQEDAAKAANRNARSLYYARDIRSAVIDVGIARRQAVSSGDLTEEQFADLEIKDGRLVDGTSVYSLFYSDDIEPALQYVIGDIDPANTNVEEVNAALFRAYEVQAKAKTANEKKRADLYAGAMEFVLIELKAKIQENLLLRQQIAGALGGTAEGGYPDITSSGRDISTTPQSPGDLTGATTYGSRRYAEEQGRERGPAYENLYKVPDEFSLEGDRTASAGGLENV